MRKELLAVLAILVLAGCANTGNTEHSQNDPKAVDTDYGWEDEDNDDDFDGK